VALGSKIERSTMFGTTSSIPDAPTPASTTPFLPIYSGPEDDGHIGFIRANHDGRIEAFDTGEVPLDVFANWHAAADAILDRCLGVKSRSNGGASTVSEAPGLQPEPPVGSASDPLTIARGYRKRGWNPIPVSRRTKKPIGYGWQQRRLTEETVAEVFNRADMNVGVQLGPLSNGLTDVDPDCREAVMIGSMLLPGSNNVFGRASKPRSHWLYGTTLADKINKACLQFKDVDGTMMLELKIGGGGKGSQSVFPGSTHVSGEAIEWDKDGALVTVDDDMLLQQVQRLAVAVMLARHWPVEGARHDTALTVGGFLARAGFDEDAAALMLEAIAEATGDEQGADRAQAARDAVKQYGNGGDTRGYPALAEAFGEKVADKAAEWLGYTAREQLAHAIPATGVTFRDCYKGGFPKPSLANAVIAIRALGIDACHDLFHHRVDVVYKGEAKTIHEGLLTDDTISAVRSLINNTYQVDCGDNLTLAAIKEVARDNAFDPVLDMLDDFQSKWDGAKRLDTWVIDYLGCEDTPLHRAFGRIVLVAACRRARVPGCKFDNITNLEGPEGKNKSTAIRVLAGDDNFSDQSIIGASDKEVQEQLDGIWMHENADLAGMRKADVDKVNAFASRQVDRARPAYGRVREDRPRRSIEWGTINLDEYLLRQTGNRRWWPLKTGKIDLEALIRDRAQLLGEAATYEAAGESIILDEQLWDAAKDAQEQRRVVDPWEDILADMPDDVIHTAGDGYERVASAEVLESVLGIPRAQQISAHGQRLSLAMKRAGWERNDSGLVMIDGRNTRGYVRQSAVADSGEETKSESYIERGLVQFLNQYINGHSIYTDRTWSDCLGTIRVFSEPLLGRPVYIQVVRDERRILISRKAFHDYLRKERIQAGQVIAGLAKHFHSKEVRLALAAGTAREGARGRD
jgi:predicted P-loop ATPase